MYNVNTSWVLLTSTMILVKLLVLMTAVVCRVRPNKDIVAAVKEVDSVISTLQDVRNNISTHHASWYSIEEEMCSDICTEPSISRRCGRQVHRSNIPAHTPSDYYCHCISIPLIDHLLSEMQSRFTKHLQTALLGLSIVPSVLVKLSDKEFSTTVWTFADR